METSPSPSAICVVANAVAFGVSIPASESGVSLQNNLLILHMGECILMLKIFEEGNKSYQIFSFQWLKNYYLLIRVRAKHNRLQNTSYLSIMFTLKNKCNHRKLGMNEDTHMLVIGLSK